jgi:hypothetical protein
MYRTAPIEIRFPAKIWSREKISMDPEEERRVA